MNEYGWRGMMLILGGLSLNLVICGALYRPLATREYKRKYRSKRNLQKFEFSSRRSRDSGLCGTPPPKPSLGSEEENDNPDSKLLVYDKASSDNAFGKPRDDFPTPPAFTRSCDVVSFDTVPNKVISQTSSGVAQKARRRRSKNPREVKLIPTSRQPQTIAPLSRVDIFYRGSVICEQQIPLVARQQSTPTSTTIFMTQRARATSCPNIPSHEPQEDTWQEAVEDFFDEVNL